MAGPILRLIRRTGRGRFLGAAALSTFYAVWLAAGDSPLRRARVSPPRRWQNSARREAIIFGYKRSTRCSPP